MARKPSREERREAEAAQQKALLADIHTRYEIMKEEAQKSSEYWQREREAREASRKRELGAFVDADDKEHLLEKLDQEAKNLLKCEKFSEEDVIKANQWRDEAKAAVEEAWREEQEKNLLTDRIFSICEDLSHKGGDSACNTCKNVGRLKKKLKKR
jgi:adenosine deaminase